MQPFTFTSVIMCTLIIHMSSLYLVLKKIQMTVSLNRGKALSITPITNIQITGYNHDAGDAARIKYASTGLAETSNLKYHYIRSKK